MPSDAESSGSDDHGDNGEISKQLEKLEGTENEGSKTPKKKRTMTRSVRSFQEMSLLLNGLQGQTNGNNPYAGFAGLHGLRNGNSSYIDMEKYFEEKTARRKRKQKETKNMIQGIIKTEMDEMEKKLFDVLEKNNKELKEDFSNKILFWGLGTISASIICCITVIFVKDGKLSDETYKVIERIVHSAVGKIVA